MLNQSPSPAAERTWWTTPADWVVVVVLFIATFAFVSSLPRNLGASDEGLYLYEAKRILEGQVMYRDIFELVTPGAWYLMAMLFGLFGTTMTTARGAMAVVHAMIAVSLYLTCRQASARMTLSLAAALAYLALCQPVWPYASPHWISTLIVQVLLLALLRQRWTTCMGSTLVPGFLVGLLICVQQQKGVVIGGAAALILLVDCLLDDRPAGPGVRRRVLRTLGPYIGGIAVAVVPILGISLFAAGPTPVFRALVVHPLSNYRRSLHSDWGALGLLIGDHASYTFPWALKYSPVLLAVALARIAYCWRRQNGAEIRLLLVLFTIGVGSIASIAYFPDFIHIAFIAPVFLVLLATLVERALRGLDVLPAAGAVTWVLALGVVALLGWRLQRNLTRSRATYPLSYSTAFGELDLQNQWEIQLIDRVNALMAPVPSREIFFYPGYPAAYLTTNTRNPTPYQLLLPGYHDPDQLQLATELLDRRAVPYVVVVAMFVKPDDPLLSYLGEHYAPMDSIGPGMFLYRRIGGGAGGRGAPD